MSVVTRTSLINEVDCLQHAIDKVVLTDRVKKLTMEVVYQADFIPKVVLVDRSKNLKFEVFYSNEIPGAIQRVFLADTAKNLRMEVTYLADEVIKKVVLNDCSKNISMEVFYAPQMPRSPVERDVVGRIEYLEVRCAALKKMLDQYFTILNRTQEQTEKERLDTQSASD
jgi:hypothetical protein